MNMCRTIKLLCIAALALAVLGCDSTKEQKGSEMYKTYQVQRADKTPKLNGDWAGEIWGSVKPLDIKNHMGDEPEHKPKTQAKLLYDDKFVYVIFRVEDRYVRAVAKKYQDMVCRDSCVEFFVTPGNDLSLGYFNLETNCGGTMLLYYQTARSTNQTILSEADCKQVEIYHSEPKTVEPEKTGPTTWVVEYRVPFDLLDKFTSVTKPAPGVKWRANFYKCADETSHPHWLTWSVVDLPKPDFHRPEFFGTLEFM